MIMSAVEDKITADYTAAMKAGIEGRKNTLRLMRAAIKSAAIDKRAPLTDEEVWAVLSKQAKQRKDSIEQYAAGGRQDLVDEEKAELTIIEEYLPQQLGRAEIEALAREVIASLGVSGAGAMGQVMRELMPRTKGKADGKLVNEVVRGLLTQV